MCEVWFGTGTLDGVVEGLAAFDVVGLVLLLFLVHGLDKLFILSFWDFFLRRYLLVVNVHVTLMV